MVKKLKDPDEHIHYELSGESISRTGSRVVIATYSDLSAAVEGYGRVASWGSYLHVKLDTVMTSVKRHTVLPKPEDQADGA